MLSISNYISRTWVVLAILLGSAVIQVGCLNFSYPTFPRDKEIDFIRSQNTYIASDAIQVTPDHSVNSISNTAGGIWYNKKFKLWSKRKNSTATFNSTFVLNITPRTQPGGEGLAFVLTREPSIPDNSEGQWLGIVNASTNGSSSSQIVAVEFDTRKSFQEDVDNNHVGVNVNSINSIEQVPLSSYGVNLSSGINVTASVQYNGTSGMMKVFVIMSNGTDELNTVDPIISLQLNLFEYLPEDVYVGFTASTGDLTQLNCVRAWSFTSEDIKEESSYDLLWIWILVPVLIILFIGLTIYLYCRRKLAKDQKEAAEPNIEQEIEGSTTGPRKFRLKELKYATEYFHPKNKLGEGGFGTVYKGFLKDINMEVAVKRVSRSSHQSKQEFIAEVKTISRIRHKHLVKLIGYCYEGNELLLVYDFMPKGSLDQHIFSEESLGEKKVVSNWETRLNIICGVASALDYLHYGCDKRVLHRDLKASNVMLDSELNAQLGDFGLARAVQNQGETHYSTNQIAGTPGYMAPECFLTGRATVETDVYGFGVFILEVACGRRPGKQNHHNNIVDWVWELYGRKRILDCVDPRLDGNFDDEQKKHVLMLGLACCHPNPTMRPSMRVVFQVLTGDRAPLAPPADDKPAFVWPVTARSGNDEDFSLNGEQLQVQISVNYESYAN